MAPVVRNTGVFLFAESYGILCEKRGADAVKHGGENKNLALGIALGLMGAAGGLVTSLRRMDRQGAAEQKRQKTGESPVYFNSH